MVASRFDSFYAIAQYTATVYGRAFVAVHDATG